MDHPENETMGVLVIAALPELKKLNIRKGMGAGYSGCCLCRPYTDKMLDTVTVGRLEYWDWQWVFAGEMPMPNYDVTVGRDGTWH